MVYWMAARLAFIVAAAGGATLWSLGERAEKRAEKGGGGGKCSASAALLQHHGPRHDTPASSAFLLADACACRGCVVPHHRMRHRCWLWEASAPSTGAAAAQLHGCIWIESARGPELESRVQSVYTCEARTVRQMLRSPAATLAVHTMW